MSKYLLKKYLLKRLSGLFLTWFRWKNSIYIELMYFRSRVMFFQTLWNKELIQKKFFNSNKIEILIQSKFEINFQKIDLKEKIIKLNKQIDMNFILKFEKDFRNFYGHIVIFEYNASLKKNSKKEKMLGIAFFNLVDLEMEYLKFLNFKYISNFITDTNDYTVFMYRICTEEDYETIIFLLKFFFENNSNIKINNWINNFYELYYKIINENLWNIFMDKDVIFHKFDNLNNIIEFLKNVK